MSGSWEKGSRGKEAIHPPGGHPERSCRLASITTKGHSSSSRLTTSCPRTCCLLSSSLRGSITSSLASLSHSHTSEIVACDTFKLWFWKRLLRVLWTTKRSNQSILKEISPEYSLEGLMLKLKPQYLGLLMRTAGSLEKTLMLGKANGEEAADMR